MSDNKDRDLLSCLFNKYGRPKKNIPKYEFLNEVAALNMEAGKIKSSKTDKDFEEIVERFMSYGIFKNEDKYLLYIDKDRVQQIRNEWKTDPHPPKCEFYHTATTPVPEEYKQNEKSCGPLVGNETELAYAVANKKEDGRILKTKAGNYVVFVRQTGEKEFEVFFRSFKERDEAEIRLEERRDRLKAKSKSR
jgi:hypothetical protein